MNDFRNPIEKLTTDLPGRLIAFGHGDRAPSEIEQIFQKDLRIAALFPTLAHLLLFPHRDAHASDSEESRYLAVRAKRIKLDALLRRHGRAVNLRQWSPRYGDV